MAFKIFYKGISTNYPEFDTEKEAIDFYVKEIQKQTGKTRDEILGETYTSAQGITKCVSVKKIDK